MLSKTRHGMWAMNEQDTFLNLKLFRNVIDKKSKIKNYML